MKKRLLSLLLAVCMVATLFSGLTVNASAAVGVLDNINAIRNYLERLRDEADALDLENLDVEAILTAAKTSETSGDFGAEGNNLHWEVADGVLTITGSGAMEDFDFAAGNLPPWWNTANLFSISGLIIKTTGIQSIVVADTVTSIGEFAFFALPELTTVTLPAGLSALPRYSLAACSELTFPTLPETLVEIEDYALAACDTFTGITLPASVQVIGGHAFAGCDGLTGVDLPDTVRSLGAYAFSSCSALTSAALPVDITAVPKFCFFNCEKLRTVTYRGTVTEIGESAFAGCEKLTTAPIPETVTAIGNSAFSGCRLLSRATLPAGLQTLGERAFDTCEVLTSITLPDAITVVPKECFNGCILLSDVTLAPNTTEIGEGAFFACGGMLKTIALPDTLKVIGENAFAECLALAELTLPDGLETIGNSAFLGCTALTALDFPESVTAIGDSAFSGCDALTDAWFYGDAPTVTAADNISATFVKNTITIHYPEDNSTWIIIDGKWNGYNAASWNFCRHENLIKGETVAPTCTTKGYTVYTCEDCGRTLHLDETDMRAHDLQAVVVAPTCTEPGYTKYVCKDCGYEDIKHTDLTPFTGHSYELTRTVTAPTCTTAGEGEYTCKNCGKTETRALPATGHTLVTQPAVAATCTTAGKTEGSYCSVCGTVVKAQENVPALGHNFVETSRVEPTETTDGYAISTCTRCSETQREVLPATGPTQCDGGASCPQANFTDKRAPGYWSHSAIDYCVANGILYGVETTRFGCEEATTRGQLVAMLYRIQGSPAKYQMYYIPFVDVASNAYYYAAIAWAYDNSIVAGTSATTFSPNDPITREQMATILYNYTLKYAPSGATGSTALNFPDAGSVSNYAVIPLQWAVANGIVSGTQEGSTIYLDPQGTATREQVASILMRYQLNIAKK